MYASPIFEAVPGSVHGYDVTNPLRINPEIGTLNQLRSVSRRLKKLGISWLQDIVPNHMAFHPQNEWLMDVMQKGRGSRYARVFDISWDSPLHDVRLMVPFLGKTFDEAVDANEIAVAYKDGRLRMVYFDNSYPLNASAYRSLMDFARQQLSNSKTSQRNRNLFDKTFTDAFLNAVNKDHDLLKSIHSQQYYRLCHWQETDKSINYRRFFTVNGLICLNMQDEAVFERYHTLIKTLVQQGIFQGLRVDHIDGLFDPPEYLRRLRRLYGEQTYIIVEKILESGLGEEIGKELLTCGEDLKSNSLNRCALQLHTAAIFGVDTHIPTGLGVGLCYYYKKSFNGLKAKRLHCPGGTEYKLPY